MEVVSCCVLSFVIVSRGVMKPGGLTKSNVLSTHQNFSFFCVNFNLKVPGLSFCKGGFCLFLMMMLHSLRGITVVSDFDSQQWSKTASRLVTNLQ